MKRGDAFRITSFLCMLLAITHMSQDSIRGYDSMPWNNLTAAPIGVIWLYAVLLLHDRRSGYVIMSLGALMSLYASYLHMSGVHFVQHLKAQPDGAFFFAWSLLVMGILALFTLTLSVRGLLDPKWLAARSDTNS